jgi:transcriptional regulator with XRE-family HTH domain
MHYILSGGEYMNEKEWLETFSDNLAELLADAKMTQTELSKETGLAESTISDYLHGRQMPGVRAIVNLSYALDVDCIDLIDFGCKITK